MDAIEKIVRFRAEKGLAQTVVAETAGVPQSFLSKIEHREAGAKKPRYQDLLRIANALGLDLQWFFDDDQAWPPRLAVRPRGTPPVVLTPAEKRLLEIAHDVSEDDDDPALLKTARRLLLRQRNGNDGPHDPVPVRQPRPVGPTEDPLPTQPPAPAPPKRRKGRA